MRNLDEILMKRQFRCFESFARALPNNPANTQCCSYDDGKKEDELHMLPLALPLFILILTPDVILESDRRIEVAESHVNVGRIFRGGQSWHCNEYLNMDPTSKSTHTVHQRSLLQNTLYLRSDKKSV